MKTVNEIIQTVKLSGKEIELLKVLNGLLCNYFGETYSDIDVNDLALELNWSKASVKGVLGSLVKKGILFTWESDSGYDLISFNGQENMEFEEMVVNEIPVKETSAKTIRKVGDIHSNGKWIWTEYKPGKFDWRVIKKNDKQAFRASKPKLEGGILETEEQQSVEVEVDANGNFKAEGWKLTETPAPTVKVSDFVAKRTARDSANTVLIKEIAVELADSTDRVIDKATERLAESGKFSDKTIRNAADRVMTLIDKARQQYEKKTGLKV